MKIFKLLCILSILSLVPLGFSYALLPQSYFYLTAITWCGGLLLLLTYVDKVLLSFLNAREVADMDGHILFQAVKSQSYRSFQKQPKVYLYSGSGKCLVLESRNDWCLVIDRKLLQGLSEQQVKALITYLFDYKIAGYSWYQTKAIALGAFTFLLIAWILQNILRLKVSGRPFRVLFLFLLSLIRPIIGPIDYFARKVKKISADLSLRPIYFNVKEMGASGSYNSFLLRHFERDIDFQKNLIAYIENFPMIENCSFESANEV